MNEIPQEEFDAFMHDVIQEYNGKLGDDCDFYFNGMFLGSGSMTTIDPEEFETLWNLFNGDESLMDEEYDA